MPQGSLKAFTPKGWKRPILTSTSKDLKTWRAAMTNAIQVEMKRLGLEVLRGPVSVSLTFHLIKPKSAPKKRVIFPIKRPDLDKLIRACFDALTGTIILDDSQVTTVLAKKIWETVGPGVMMEVKEMGI